MSRGFAWKSAITLTPTLVSPIFTATPSRSEQSRKTCVDMVKMCARHETGAERLAKRWPAVTSKYSTCPTRICEKPLRYANDFSQILVGHVEYLEVTAGHRL